MAGADFFHDEFKQLGTDYGSPEEVARYDARMRRFRDVEAENAQIVSRLGLGPEDAFLEIGSGTGALSRRAAAVCRRVVAVDISPVMLDYARSRAREEGRDNIEFIHAGFLSFKCAPGEFAAAASGLALHHLPELWKQEALRRLRRALRPGGVLMLEDVVYSPEPGEDLEEYLSRIVELAPGSRENFAAHIAGELSTFDWIMRGMLERAGFEIFSDECRNGFLHFYYCRAQ